MKLTHITVRKRLAWLLIFGLIIFLIINLHLGYVQIFSGDALLTKAKNLWSRNVPFEGKRGEIKDRNGEILATNVSAPTVFVISRQIEDIDAVTELLVRELKADEKKIRAQLNKKTMIQRISEGRKIKPEVAKKIYDADLAGVFIAEDSLRHYPNGRQLAHVLGFTGIDNQGLVGLELTYDKLLKGQQGNVKIYADAKGNKLKGLADDFDEPEEGNSLYLTIDQKVQSVIERELDIAQAKYNPDQMLAIAVNPNSGEILGMSSRPNYDPSDYEKVSQDVYNRNLPVWSTYEPGSTFKIITLAAALEEGKVDLENEVFVDTGSVAVEDSHLHCWKDGGHGEQTFLEVVQNSCNPGFVELGNRLGKETLFSYIEKFGFGKKTGIDLSGEGTGIMFDIDDVGPLELATTAFGQGVSVTPIQQVMAVAAAVNGGILYKPYIAKKVQNSTTGEVILENKPEQQGRIISEATSKQVREALEQVVALGTGRGAYVDGYRVGGKTGTAQKAVNGRYLENNYIVSFMGFAPADNPEIVVYLAIDNPKGTVQFGGVVAAPIVGNIMEDVLPVLKVAPRTEQIEKEYQWPDPITVEVPNLINLNKSEVMQQLINLNVEIAGTGKKVVEQSPEPGVKVQEGTTIRLMFGS